MNFHRALVFIFSSLTALSAGALNYEFKPSVGLAFGKYQDQDYSEVRAGGIFHVVSMPFYFHAQGFRRFLDEAEDFYGLDFDLKIRRQFQISNDILVGTQLGPGYRFSTNDFDAPYLDFAFSYTQRQLFAFQIGYKIVFLKFENSELENDNIIYVSVNL